MSRESLDWSLSSLSSSGKSFYCALSASLNLYWICCIISCACAGLVALSSIPYLYWLWPNKLVYGMFCLFWVGTWFVTGGIVILIIGISGIFSVSSFIEGGVQGGLTLQAAYLAEESNQHCCRRHHQHQVGHYYYF